MTLALVNDRLESVACGLPKTPAAGRPVMTVEEAAAGLCRMDAQLSLLNRSRALAERALAAQGDAAEPSLVTLQHDLTVASIMRRKFLTQ